MSENKPKGKTPENQNGTPNSFDNKKTQTKKPKFNPIWIYAILAAIFLGITFLNPSGGLKKDTGEVLQMIKNGDVAKLNVVNRNRAEVYLTKEAKEKDTYKKDIRKPNFPGGEDIYTYYMSDIGPADKFQETIDAAQIDLKPEQRIITNWIAESDPWASPILQMLLWVGILVLVWMFVMRRMGGSGGAGGGQIFSIGKSKAQLFDKDTKVNVTFKDVAGLEGAKEEVMEIVDFLKNPTKYSNLGGKIPKGALLVGPPGTGKTLLAKAVAGEADVPFFSLSGSDFVEMFVGVGASRVRDLFRQAKEKAPCIIFIDEIDAIGRARGKNAMQ